MATEAEAVWLTPAQAARLLDCSVQTLRNLADQGKLEMQRTPLGRLISAESVEAMRKERA